MTEVTANKPLYNSILQMKRMALEKTIKPPFIMEMTESNWWKLMQELGDIQMYDIAIAGLISGFREYPEVEGVRIRVIPDERN